MSVIKMRKTRYVLNYRETKPVVYKLRQLTYPPVKSAELVKYIANSAHIPESTVHAAVAAITEGILYFTINGSQVTIPGFGGFYMGFKTKTTDDIETIKEDGFEKYLIRTPLRFVPLKALRTVVKSAGTEIMGSGVYELQSPTPEPEP